MRRGTEARRESGRRAWWLAVLLGALPGCTSPAPDSASLRAPSAEAARQVVVGLIDAVHRGDVQAITASLCPSNPAERSTLLELFLGEGQQPAAGRATPSWSGDAPVFEVELLLKSGAAAVRRLVVVRAREGCVSDAVNLEVQPDDARGVSPSAVDGGGSGADLAAGDEEIEL